MSGIFEHLSAFDEQKIVNTRKAVAVANKRYEDRYAHFLNTSDNLDEYLKRYALVEEDIKEMLEDVGAEYDADPERLEASLKEAKGGFCDECKKWKSGPKAGCTCGSDDKSDEKDDDSDDTVTDDKDTDDERESSVKQAEITSQPIMTAVPLPDEPGKGIPDIDGELEEAPSAVGYQTISSETSAMQRARQLITAKQAADAPTGDSAEKREKLPKGDESALGGPSPKIDKKTWKPNALNENGNLKPIDTEGKGSKNPTTDQDIKDKPDWDSDDFLRDIGGDTTESQSVSEDTGDFAADHTDTWSGTEGLADPVTQTAVASTHEADFSQHLMGDGPCPSCGGPFHNGACASCGYQAGNIQAHDPIGGSPFEQHIKDKGWESDLGPGQLQEGRDHLKQLGEDIFNPTSEDKEHYNQLAERNWQYYQEHGQLPPDPNRLAANDPDKNPIKEILEAKVDFVPRDDVLSAISSFEEK